MKRVWLVGILTAALMCSLPVHADTPDDGEDVINSEAEADDDISETDSDGDEYVDIPDTREKIQSGIFTAAVEEDGTVMITEADFFSGEPVEIPAEIEGHAVSAIGSGAFEYGYFEDLIIPDTVVLIESDAFAYAEVEYIFKLPENVQIDADAFCYANLPEEISIPRGAVTGDESFAYLEKTRQVKIEDTAEIGEQSFAYAEELESIEAGDEVVIGKEAFSYCDYLESVAIGSKAEIGEEAFAYCVSLEYAEIGAQASIGNEAFAYCESLTTVKIGEDAELGDDVFYDCPSLDFVDMTDGSVDVNAPGGDDVDEPGGEGDDKIDDDPKNTDTLVDWNIKVVVPEDTEAVLDESDGCYYIYPDDPGYIPYVLLKPYEYDSVDAFIQDFTEYMASVYDDLEVTSEPVEKTIGDKECVEIDFGYTVSGYDVVDRRIATVSGGMTYMFASKEVPELDETVGTMLEDVIADCIFITE